MISPMPEKILVFNEGDELPVTGMPDGQVALNKDNPKEMFVFDLPSRTWKPL